MRNSYSSHWQDYKRKRNTTLFLLLTYLPAVALFGPLLRALTGYADAIEAIATIWLIAYVVAALRLAYWRCPRCKGYFLSRRTITANPFVSACVHCGLPKWALDDAGNSSAGCTLRVKGMPQTPTDCKYPPEHVILLHGMGRTKRSMALLERRLRTAGFTTANIGYPSLSKNISRLAAGHLAPAIDQCRAAGAVRIHIVTHSLGGIIVRQYLQDRELPSGSRIVMLAPPNQGSELAELLKNFFLYRWIMGPAAQQLGIGPDSVPLALGPIAVETGIIIGSKSLMPFGGRIFNGPNDGKVSVERAKLTGMRDFLVLPAGHAFIMRNPTVIEQVIHFLQHGAFDQAYRRPHGA